MQTKPKYSPITTSGPQVEGQKSHRLAEQQGEPCQRASQSSVVRGTDKGQRWHFTG
jgi:hypothetical protein